jgi:hypothetical protein
MDELNIATLAPYFTDEAAAWELVEKMRWANGPVCPHCHATDHQVHSTVVPNVQGADAPQGHRGPGDGRRQYVRGDVSTNQCENYFSQLKSSIDGTHQHVSTTHLPRYLAEFDFRASTHRLSDTGRMHRLMDQTSGKRLAYRRLTAKA